MTVRNTLLTAAIALAAAACSSGDTTPPPPAPIALAKTLAAVSGSFQVAPLGDTLAAPLVAIVKDSAGKPLAGVPVTWTVQDQPSGTFTNVGTLLTPATMLTGADGTVSARLRLSAIRGNGYVYASVSGLQMYATYPNFAYVPPLSVNVAVNGPTTPTCAGITASYVATVVDASPGADRGVTAGINWLTGSGDTFSGLNVISTGVLYGNVTYGTATGPHAVSVAVGGITSAPVARIVASPCPASQVSVTAVGGTVVSPATPVMLTARLTNDSGLGVSGTTVSWVTSGGTLAAPTSISNADGVATTTLSVTGTPGLRLVLANVGDLQAQLALTNLVAPPPLVATINGPASATTLGTVRVRDGLAFVGAANQGMLIYDVGNGIAAGTPAAPHLVSQIVTADDGIGFGPAAYTSWWFKNPVTGQNKYLFVGQKWSDAFALPTQLGDIHIVDVSDISHPTEVGFIHVPGGGVRDLWMDEANQALYAAYEGAGVVKFDVSGALSGDMSSRKSAQSTPTSGTAAEAWAVKSAGGALYSSDLSRGLLAFTLAGLGGYDQPSVANAFPAGGGMSDLYAPDAFGYTGTINICDGGIRVWNLGPAPTLANSITFPGSVCAVAGITGSADGKMMVAGAEQGTGAGIWIYDRTTKATPKIIAYYQVAVGVRAIDVATIGGRTYIFATTDSPGKQLLILDATAMVP